MHRKTLSQLLLMGLVLGINPMPGGLIAQGGISVDHPAHPEHKKASQPVDKNVDPNKTNMPVSDKDENRSFSSYLREPLEGRYFTPILQEHLLFLDSRPCTRAVSVEKMGQAKMEDCQKCHTHLQAGMKAQIENLDIRIEQLVAEVKVKKDDNKLKELKALVEQSFAQRHQTQIAEADVLREKLERVIGVLKKREARKGEIIDRRMKQLLGDSDDLDWIPGTAKVALPQPIRVDSGYIPPINIGSTAKMPLNGIFIPGGGGASYLVPGNPPTNPDAAEPKPITGFPINVPGFNPGAVEPKAVPGIPIVPGSQMPEAKPAGEKSKSGIYDQVMQDDIRLQEIQVELAKVRLEHATAEHKRLESAKKGNYISAAEVEKNLVEVKVKKLELEAEMRKLELLQSARKGSSLPPVKGNLLLDQSKKDLDQTLRAIDISLMATDQLMAEMKRLKIALIEGEEFVRDSEAEIKRLRIEADKGKVPATTVDSIYNGINLKEIELEANRKKLNYLQLQLDKILSRDQQNRLQPAKEPEGKK